MDSPLNLLVLVIAVGIGAQWLAARYRFPVILLLLAAGILSGPVFGVIEPETLFGDLLKPLVSLAVAIILFEGGLCLELREARQVGKALRRLMLAGLVIGSSLTAYFGVALGGLSLPTAAVLGSILVVTGPTVILPLLRGARIASRPATLLKWEGIANDPLGALLAYFVLQVAVSAGQHEEGAAELADSIIRFIGTSVIAGILGALCGSLLDRALDRGWLAEHIKSLVIFASVLVVFSVCETIAHESGLLAVTVMGMVMTNVGNPHMEEVRRFKEQFTTLLVSVLFILLSARLELQALAFSGPSLLLIASIVFVVRPIVGLVGTLGCGLPFKERLLIAWIAPRGVVAAAVASAFAPDLLRAGYEDADRLEPLVFGVIVCTVVLHGLSLKPLARKLGLAHQDGNGILVVGASRWAVKLCQVLAQAGAFVVLADTRFRKVARARLEGLEVHYGDVLAEEAAMELPMERVSWVLSIADEDAYNALVCVRFGPELGREHMLQLSAPTGDGNKEVTAHMSGRAPWGDKATYAALASRWYNGSTFKLSSTSKEYPWDDMLAKLPDALFLFYVHQGRLKVISEGEKVPVGAKVIYMT